MSWALEKMRDCLEGIVPCAVATCGADGMPNVTYVSQTMYVDSRHIALSFQFFNKTRENILANPIASVLMMDPYTAARYQLTIHYLKTETSGPLFERMRAKLAGIASHEGMEGVFQLRGVDLYRVLEIEHLPGRELPPTQYGPALLPALRNCVGALASYGSLEDLVDNLLGALDRHFQIQYSMLLMADLPGNKLYTLASRGYGRSGVGAEIPLGVGVIGVAGREQVPIRIMFAASEYVYSRTVREQAINDGLVQQLEERIPMPGLEAPASQIAVPILCNDELLGVLYAESEQECQFGYDMEDALVAICAQAGEAIGRLRLQVPDHPVSEAVLSKRKSAAPDGETLQVRYYPRDHSIFCDNEYLIKGVAGAILWYLLSRHAEQGRTEFSNRELRLAQAIPLPDITDNLDARLLLLSRRLQERCAALSLEKSGRGRFHLVLRRPVALHAED
ncbi:Adenylate cyclase [Marinobacterium lacunae]|uniref:Adenylate cyclase n=1 Tax=Marinobacterium lacunae TaxID=1232683 RepID=A0A081G4F8_9GAMM|nr:pyridoxamine 5'-phosphate oxidase family protein [Marinobacterium lacunae]KEA65663.1 Adenylate cyclase [Marinobacterium lacunae]